MTFNQQWFNNLNAEEKAFVIKTQVDRELLAPWVLDAYLSEYSDDVPECDRITREQIEKYVDLQLQRNSEYSGVFCLMKPYITQDEWNYHKEHGKFPGNYRKLKRWFSKRLGGGEP